MSNSFKKNSLFLTLIFVVACAIIFFLMGITYKNLQKLSDTSEMISHTYLVSQDIEKLYTSIKDIETAKRDYILTQDESLKIIINDKKKEIQNIYNSIEYLTKDNPVQQANLKELNKMIHFKYKIVDDALKLHYEKLEGKKLRENLLEGKAIMASIKSKIDEMVAIENNLLQERKSVFDYTKNSSPILIYIISLFSLGILGFAFYRINKDLKNISLVNNQLLLKEESSKLAEEIGNFGKWEWDVESNVYKFSDNIYRLLGHKPQSVPATLDFFMNHIHQDDRKYVDDIVAKMIVEKSFHPFKYRIIKEDTKEIRYFFANNRLIKDDNKREILLGTTTDITEQVSANQKIEERNIELEEKNKNLIISNETNQEAETVGHFGTWQWFFNEDKYYFSENLFRIFGLEPIKDNKNLSVFLPQIHPEDMPIVEEKMKEMIEKKHFEPFVHKIYRANDKELRYISVNNKLVEDKKIGKYLLVITVDVTEDIESQLTIERRNKELQDSYNQLVLSEEALKFGEEIGKYGNWQWNVKDDKWYFSENLYRILGAEPYSFEANLENFFKYMHPEDLDYVKEKAAEMVEIENLPAFTYRILRPSGEIVFVKSVGRPIFDKQGNKMVAGSTLDITEEVLKGEETLQKNRELEASNKELQAFNYVASHDLQEPLRKIETFISRLVEKDINNVSDSGKQYIERIQSSAKRMRVLINDLLQFSRTSRSDQKFEKTDLNEQLHYAINELNQIIEEKNAVINIEGTLPTTQAIPFQIQQLFINLIGNSLKYAKTDINPLITISIEKVNADSEVILPKNALGKFYKISFADNGIGFEQEFAHKIFELFSRLHGKTDYAGTGIGLAICKKIVENHHGYIYAKGELNVGSTFCVFLPEK